MPLNLDFLDVLAKLTPRVSGVLTAFTGLLLFGREKWLEALGLNSICHDYKGWIGAAFCLFMFLFFSFGATFIKDCAVGYLVLCRRKKRLHRLTLDEKRALARYIQHQTRTQDFEVFNGTVNSLQSCDILTRGQFQRPIGHYFPFIIQEWAWLYLNANVHVLAPAFPVESPNDIRPS